ncbi:hypothetical protein VN97_g10378 [Penicillium thymicola]|uniref:Uncharacterized protein n=1 Tax=Penicillium thymicola TaxID=293382 RepID=A0AAI9X4F8_PENTH|nr:hypothetical protein VN97_g10378 [Penicillium thymicola]
MESFTQRFFRAARNLKNTGKAFATVERLVAEVNREKPSGAPEAQLTHHGGTRPIAIPFKESVLVELSIAGLPTEILQQFEDIIASIPAQFRVEIIDAYESTSVLFLLRQVLLRRIESKVNLN